MMMMLRRKSFSDLELEHQMPLLLSSLRSVTAPALFYFSFWSLSCFFFFFLFFFSWCSLHPLLAAITQLEGEWQVQCWATFYKALYTPNNTPTTHSDIQLLPDVLHALFVFKIISSWTLLLSLLLFREQTGICVRGCNVTLLQDRVSRQTCCGLLTSWVIDPFHLYLLPTACPLPSQKQPGASTHLRAIFVIILPTKRMQKDISSRSDSEQLRIFTLCLLHSGEREVVFYRL